MSDAYQRSRDFFGDVSGSTRVLSTDTGVIPLIPAMTGQRIWVQKIHVEVTAPAASELWTFQDGGSVPLVPNVSAAAISHFDFDFGPDGVPCGGGTQFALNISGAVGAVGWVSFEAYRRVTPMGYADIVLADAPLGFWRLGEREGYAQAVLGDSPVGYWRLGETSGAVAIDSAPTPHNGAYVGGVTLQQPGPLADGNTAALFDGATGYADMGNVAAFNFTGAFSAEAWIKFIDQIHNLTIVAKTNWATGAGWHLGLQSGKLVGWAYSPALVLVFNFNSNPVLYSDLGWHHVALTWDGTTNPNGAKLYADGVVIAQATAAAGTPGNATDALRIASSVNVPNFYAGSVDDVAVYSYALSAAQIANHYALRTSPIATVGVLTVVDASGNSRHGTPSGGVVFGLPGAVPGDTAASFDGIAGYISVPHVAALAPPGDFSVEAWIRQSVRDEFDIVNHYGLGNFTGFLFAVSEAAVDGRLGFWTGGGWSVGVRTVDDGQWHHVVATLTGTTARIYIDGVLDSTSTATVSLAPVTAALEIGRRHDTLKSAAGLIDEVALYGYALNAAQIVAHYRAGVAGR